MSQPSEPATGPIVGIDLGTTNSVVAAVVDGQPRVLEEAGERILPSVAGMDEQGKLITGFPARNQLAAFPERTIASIKRRMGRMDPVRLGDEQFTPPEVSAMLLRRLRERASLALKQPVERAVVTVPAFFDESQRQATRTACEMAGLKVERIINEPTAATLVYHAGSDDRKQIVVYDLGGGTFDVSVVRMEAGVVEVLSSNGDTQLGGDDFDAALMQRVADDFYDQHEIDLRQNPSTRYRLLQACERAKQQLSEQHSVEVVEEFITEKQGQPLNLRHAVSREEYQELIAPLIDRTIECVDHALQEAGATIHQIDDLVLVGGSTRTPLVQDRLRAEFGREPSRAVDPDLAVALGAATQAAMIEGVAVGPVLVDVTPHTLGLEIADGYGMDGPRLVFSPIIHRNSPLPARHERSYSTMHDEQTSADIPVLQGEQADVNRNRSIGQFRLGLEAGAGDRSRVVVRFDLTLDGTLRVTATQPATGLSEELVINNALSQFDAEDRERAEARLGAMFDDSDELTADTDLPANQTWESPTDLGSSTGPFADATALLEKAQRLLGSAGEADAEDIRHLATNLQRAMTEDDETAVATIREELEDILFYVQ